MRILIMHLSDIHFGQPEGHVSRKIEALRGVVQANSSEVEACFIVVAGDIAYSGKRKEYEVALNFFGALRTAIESISGLGQVEYVLVPGNHDCDFEGQQQDREIALSVDKKQLCQMRDVSTADICTGVQEQYFQFVSDLLKRPLFTGFDRLFYVLDFVVNARKLRFHCYNTAWMSRMNETQGSLVVPDKTLFEAEGECDLRCAVFHHPYDWLDAGSSNFRRHVETTSDIILTGHGHDCGQYFKQKIAGETNLYLEGGVLQDPTTSESSFNVAILDLEESCQRIVQYSLTGEMYSPTNETDWLPFHGNTPLRTGRFQVNGGFREYLDDLSIMLPHPAKGLLRLHDIFVYPSLNVVAMKRESGQEETVYEGTEETINGEDLVDYVARTKRVVLYGSDQSGKSTLLKKLYADFLPRGVVPVLLHGCDLTPSIMKKESNTANSYTECSQSSMQKDIGSSTSSWTQRKKCSLLMI